MQLYDIPKLWKPGVIKPTMDFGISCIIMLAAESDVVFKEKLTCVYSWTAMIPQYRIL